MSTKDAYWFKHDYEPTGDPKMQALLEDYGGLGYGIFWRIVEMLHSDQSHKLPFKKYIFLAIAKQMRANAKQQKASCFQIEILPENIEKFIQDCVDEYELFERDETHFWSKRVIRNIDNKNAISQVRSESGKKGAEARSKANAKQN